MMSRFLVGPAWAVSIAVCFCSTTSAYDPLQFPEEQRDRPVMQHDLQIQDAARKRTIPVRVYLPASSQAAPVVLFSHGLGGSRKNNPYLGEHWARRGYVAVFVQHPGSDESVWKDTPMLQRMAAMRAAADLENFQARTRDVSAVIDQLEKWNRENGHALFEHLDLEHIGMSGHSFGAVTTQALSGQRFALGINLREPRIDAAVAMSPSSPRRGLSAALSFGKVDIPWLIMTGTKDVSTIGDQDVESRLAVYTALPPGNKYELVLDKAEHSAFGDRALPGETERRNPNHHRVILAVSTAFWDAYLRGDKEALEWLQGQDPKKLMEPGDRWSAK